MKGELKGARVLVVEDDYHIAALLEDALQSEGYTVAGPAPRLADALTAANREPLEAAILDINLAGERIDPVAEILERRAVPFAFLTGYDAGMLPREYADRPRLGKPFRMKDLVAMVRGLISGTGS